MRTTGGLAAIIAATLLLTACGSSSEPAAVEPDTVTSAPAEEPAATEVEPLPFNASGYLGGTAQPNLDAGEPDEVSVVQIGPLDSASGTLIFAFRNNTSESISHVDWTATARSGGSIAATGSSQGTTPAQLQPGEAGLSYIYFDNADAIPADAEYEFQVSTSAADTSPYNTAPLTVTEANVSGDSIVGGATNETGAETTGPYSVEVYCFEGDTLLSSMITFAEQTDEIPDGGTVTFSANLFGDSCPTFVLGVSGYFA
ncbi:hypothetical protein [Microbacterium memoriense]|uniref:Uncharacterized protein n=1 Tax=Microbacterium memoriense TaxID=2978350 RepID=A0ABT2PCN1_9MICO|nr:hypothetical protein [Microbacterium memoriense]MCT9002346.1 hypothetical protein [Microbacterium memoriense]